jgi:hypothetical protein
MNISAWFRQKTATQVMTFFIQAPFRDTLEINNRFLGEPTTRSTKEPVVDLQCVSEGSLNEESCSLLPKPELTACLLEVLVEKPDRVILLNVSSSAYCVHICGVAVIIIVFLIIVFVSQRALQYLAVVSLRDIYMRSKQVCKPS